MYFKSPGNNLGLDRFGQIISAHVGILFSTWWILFQYKLINLKTTNVFFHRVKVVRECVVCCSSGNKLLKLYVKMAFAYSIEERQL